MTALITASPHRRDHHPFTVTYTATPITAVRDVDFKLPASNILTFAAGVLTRTISVTIVNNTLVDGNRSFMLSLGQPTNGVQLGAQSTTNVIIQDDDQAGQFKVDKTDLYGGRERGLALDHRPPTRHQPRRQRHGRLLHPDGTATQRRTPQDYASTSGTLTFKAGETMRTVSVPIFKDHLVDGPKTFTFNLRKNPSSAPSSSRASRARWSRSPMWTSPE